MPLPTISTTTHELTLPSTGKTVKYRPFLVKEEKILILALEGGSLQDITRAIKDVLKNCILTRGIKVDKLPTFDIEYLFLNIRAKSVGESVDIIVTCPDDKVTEVRTKIYIDEIVVKKDPNHTTDIKVDDTSFKHDPDIDHDHNHAHDNDQEHDHNHDHDHKHVHQYTSKPLYASVQHADLLKANDYQHHFRDVIISTMHLHLEFEKCMEIIAVAGPYKRVLELKKSLESLKSVIVVKFLITPKK